MIKSALVLIILAIVLTACYMSQGQSLPTPDYVATSVAQTVIAYQKPSNSFGFTPEPGMNVNTAVALTLASNPTTAPPSLTMTSTSIPTTPIPTDTLTPMVTATPEDPKLALGQPTWKKTPDFGNSFYIYDDGNTRAKVEGGVLVMTAYSSMGWHGWSLRKASLQNFYLDATIRTRDCSGPDQYGLVFRSPDYTKGYFYGFTCSGNYYLNNFDGNNQFPIVPVSSSPLILAGSYQTNRIGVMAQGGTIKLYANGKLLTQAADTSYTQGSFGFFIAYINTPGFSFEVNEVAYWQLP